MTPLRHVDQSDSSVLCRSVQTPSNTKTALRSITLLAIACLVISATGCQGFRGLNEYIQYNDPMNDLALGWRNRVWSQQAWHQQNDSFEDHRQYRALGQGFRDGFQNVASGGTGCPPPLPPRKYWTWKYQTAEGQAKVAAWFEGFAYGASAAEERGAGNFQEIAVSYLIDIQSSPEFQAGQIPGLYQEQLPVPDDGPDSFPSEHSLIPLPPAPASRPPASSSERPAANGNAVPSDLKRNPAEQPLEETSRWWEPNRPRSRS
jgi:hypothetical protein